MSRSAVRGDSRIRQGLAVPGLLSRVPLPTDLVDAITQVLDCEAHEADVDVRAEMLSRARATLQAWLGGQVTTEQAIEALAEAAEPRSGIVLRELR
jgi:hypothetical protein